jgi:phosphoketolase
MTAALADWKRGYGMVKHTALTQKRVKKLVEYLQQEQIVGDGVDVYDALIAADKLTNAAMWLVVHQTYVKHIYLDGRKLAQSDFKGDPQGHLGGALNMVPAYVGYLLANVLTGKTRGWVMEQGHAVSAIDSVNLLVDNMTDAHRKRYNLSDKGLSRFSQDFYAYTLNAQGQQDSPLGSHVNPHTAGGHLEGGYLGFASLQYAHMPLPGEQLVAFLSDGAFEEQRGADWMPRWWRAEDSGLVAPVMIFNERRIDQRTTVEQEGGVQWFEKHLRLNGFEPWVFDGRDPAAFAWSIIEQERQLKQYTRRLTSVEKYDIKIPYGIAHAPKGAGFYNEGTNYAHNLPLIENPSVDKVAAERFNSHAKKLYVPLDELKSSIDSFVKHRRSKRLRERDNPIANRDVSLKKVPSIARRKISKDGYGVANWRYVSPMDAVDDAFLTLAKANQHLRPRVGNPDEMSSNRMTTTLESLEFRVVEAEEGAEESTLGAVITALNEEAVAGAAFGNKGGINLIVTYEAFGAKMFGEARQEVIFSKHKKDLGQGAKWLSVPIILTSNTWENGKNELSHQDPSLAESMLAETSDISRVFFPADFNSASVMMERLYQTHGQVWTVVVPKRKTPLWFNITESKQLVKHGAIALKWAGYKPTSRSASVVLVAVGAYQLAEVLKASERLTTMQVAHKVVYMAEPGRFRNARNTGEEKHGVSESVKKDLFPKNLEHMVIATHVRPELVLGTLDSLRDGRNVRALGFINQGGTLDVDGMLFVNKCSWLHVLEQVESMTKSRILSKKERDVINGKLSPDALK